MSDDVTAAMTAVSWIGRMVAMMVAKMATKKAVWMAD